MFEKKEPSLVQTRIQEALEEMEQMSAASAEYTTIVKNVEVLSKVGVTTKTSPSMDTLIAIGGNLVGVLMILSFDKWAPSVLPRTALNFLVKTRI